MIEIASYFSLLALLWLSAWIVWVRGRGALGFWIRPLTRKTGWAVGVELGREDPPNEDAARLAEVVALVRTLDRESGHVIRQWNRETGTRFVGLMLSKPPDDRPEAPYLLRSFESMPVLRLSGRANTEGDTADGAIKDFAANHQLELATDHPYRLSGQSFSYFEWDVTETANLHYPSESLSEWVFKLRDIVLFPVLMTLFSLALIGTGSGGLFAFGLLILIFLSGACKFVFVHQREDESQESHLQNY